MSNPEEELLGGNLGLGDSEGHEQHENPDDDAPTWTHAGHTH